MTREFIISDTHFGHGNIIELGKRPFEHNEDMVQHIMDAWNDTVGPDDVVYHLGDFGWRNPDYNLEVLSQLKFGKMVLTAGNHDSSKDLIAFTQLGVQVQDYYEIPLPESRIRCCLFHYPMQEWNGFHRGSIHCHGHTHSPIYSEMPGRYNVAVEAIGYRPKLLADVEREHFDLINHIRGQDDAKGNHRTRTQ